ncbi:MAG: hypothetical protein HQ518_12440 [Rhodopirellula sp.]|nr:hypothetical protein [Rhodopirellula sp.]
MPLTLALPETNIGGYINTGWDLVPNLVGVTAVCGLIAWRHRNVPETTSRFHTSTTRQRGNAENSLAGALCW